MKLNMDVIKFESRLEIDEVICALQEWQKTHHATDKKSQTIKSLIDKLEIMYMNWCKRQFQRKRQS